MRLSALAVDYDARSGSICVVLGRPGDGIWTAALSPDSDTDKLANSALAKYGGIRNMKRPGVAA